MCGISGMASMKMRADEHVVKAMRDILRHRGPDGEGMYLEGGIGLGHRRLSIVDPLHGHQPMFNEDEQIVIVYNGEIYNHGEHRGRLEALGHRYRTYCDTETIIHLYEEHGDDVVHHLRGMFAFALWDKRRQRLLLARDRLGVKPLYYHQAADGTLYFASEIKGLLASGRIVAGANIQAFPDFFANHATSGSATLFSGIRKLEPGHTLVWQGGKSTIQRYWDIAEAYRAPRQHRSDADYVEEWSALFRESVKLRLMADVPLGMFLSGGIDSSAIAAVMTSMVPQPVKTFSVAFAEREANELSYARLVANKFATDHHEIVVSPEMFFERLPDLVWHEDEPLAHPSSVALNFVSELAAKHVKVVLSGEGSDETLGGYARYMKTIYNVALGRRFHRATTPAIRGKIMRWLDGLPAKHRHKLERTFLYQEPDLDSLYFNNFAVFSKDQQAQLLTEDVKAKTRDTDPFQEMHWRLENLASASQLDQLLYVDTEIYLQELLMKQDQMSMAASIESRVPFLDHKLCELSASLPAHLKIRGTTTKYILRKSMAGALPPQILKRPKMGFPVPIGQWLRGRFGWILEEYVLGETARKRGYFQQVFVKQLVAEHRSGLKDHSQRLWALINFEIWSRRFLDRQT